ncbi:protein LTO1 homolog isoform X3 [Nothobranchius furzeri]|uniref:protein LTO1 homolog isoform X3 n=1 Tax=Nothobranchius furzeri TaxID=105023 RepID=UPI0024046FEB|nr:protein LTO1 homolog isoform X2 [Nothobranchius furzeri]
MKGSEVRAFGTGLRGEPVGGCRMAADMEPLMEPGFPQRKRVKALESLLAVIQTVPLADPQSVELQDGTEKLRSKFRQVCSLLNVPMDFKEHFRSAEDMSF